METQKPLIVIRVGSREHLLSSSHVAKKIYFVSDPHLNSEEKDVYFDALSHIREKLTEEDAKANLNNSYYKINKLLKELATKHNHTISDVESVKITYCLYCDLIGIGAAESLYADPEIRYIYCAGVGAPIYAEHEKYGIIKTNMDFRTRIELTAVIWRLLKKCKKHSEDKLRGIMQDNSFVVTKDLSFSIRKPKYDYGEEFLLKSKTLAPGALAYLWMALKKNKSVLIVGPPNSGKTNLLSGLLTLLPATTKVAVIEDKPGLGISNVNWSPNVAAFEKQNKMELLYEESRKIPNYFAFDELDEACANYVFQYLSICPGIVTMKAKNTDESMFRLTGSKINIPKPALANFDIAITLAPNRKVEEILEILKCDEKTNELETRTSFMTDKSGKLTPGNSRFMRSLSEEEHKELRKKTKEFMALG